MNTTDPIEARLATLPISAAERREALAYVAAGESLAQAFIAFSNWLNGTPALKPALLARQDRTPGTPAMRA